jgi:hydrogenase 3 maturation protease
MQTPDLRHALKKALESDRRQRNDGAPLVVVLGVGAELRSDDAAGVRVAAELARVPLPGVRALDGGSAPENCTAELRHLSPSHLIIVDSASMGEPPGTVRLIEPDDIGGASFGTHSLPLSVLVDYVQKEIGCRVTVIGIQPVSVAFGEGMSREVSAAVQETARLLRECLAPHEKEA